MKRKFKSSKFRKPKDVVIISYQSSGEKSVRGFWTAEFNGSMINYNKKDVLIRQAEKAGRDWMLIRNHKKERGMMSIVKYGGNKIQFI